MKKTILLASAILMIQGISFADNEVLLGDSIGSCDLKVADTTYTRTNKDISGLKLDFYHDKDTDPARIQVGVVLTNLVTVPEEIRNDVAFIDPAGTNKEGQDILEAFYVPATVKTNNNNTKILLKTSEKDEKMFEFISTYNADTHQTNVESFKVKGEYVGYDALNHLAQRNQISSNLRFIGNTMNGLVDLSSLTLENCNFDATLASRMQSSNNAESVEKHPIVNNN